MQENKNFYESKEVREQFVTEFCALLNEVYKDAGSDYRLNPEEMNKNDEVSKQFLNIARCKKIQEDNQRRLDYSNHIQKKYGFTVEKGMAEVCLYSIDLPEDLEKEDEVHERENVQILKNFSDKEHQRIMLKEIYKEFIYSDKTKMFPKNLDEAFSLYEENPFFVRSFFLIDRLENSAGNFTMDPVEKKTYLEFKTFIESSNITQLIHKNSFLLDKLIPKDADVNIMMTGIKKINNFLESYGIHENLAEFASFRLNEALDPALIAGKREIFEKNPDLNRGGILTHGIPGENLETSLDEAIKNNAMPQIKEGSDISNLVNIFEFTDQQQVIRSTLISRKDEITESAKKLMDGTLSAGDLCKNDLKAVKYYTNTMKAELTLHYLAMEKVLDAKKNDPDFMKTYDEMTKTMEKADISRTYINAAKEIVDKNIDLMSIDHLDNDGIHYASKAFYEKTKEYHLTSPKEDAELIRNKFNELSQAIDSGKSGLKEAVSSVFKEGYFADDHKMLIMADALCDKYKTDASYNEVKDSVRSEMDKAFVTTSEISAYKLVLDPSFDLDQPFSINIKGIHYQSGIVLAEENAMLDEKMVNMNDTFDPDQIQSEITEGLNKIRNSDIKDLVTREFLLNAKATVEKYDLRYDNRMTLVSVISECRDYADLKKKLDELDKLGDKFFMDGRTVNDDKGVTLSPYQVLESLEKKNPVSVYDNGRFSGVFTSDYTMVNKDVMNPSKMTLEDISRVLTKASDEISSHNPWYMKLRNFFSRRPYSEMLEAVNDLNDAVKHAIETGDAQTSEMVKNGFVTLAHASERYLATKVNDGKTGDLNDSRIRTAKMLENLMKASTLYTNTDKTVTDKIRMVSGLSEDAESLSDVMEKISEKCVKYIHVENCKSDIRSSLKTTDEVAESLTKDIISCKKNLALLDTYKAFKMNYQKMDSILNPSEKASVSYTLECVRETMEKKGVPSEFIQMADSSDKDMEKKVMESYMASAEKKGMISKDDARNYQFLLNGRCTNEDLGLRQSDFENEDRYVIHALRDSGLSMFGGLREDINRIEMPEDEVHNEDDEVSFDDEKDMVNEHVLEGNDLEK